MQEIKKFRREFELVEIPWAVRIYEFKEWEIFAWKTLIDTRYFMAGQEHHRIVEAQIRFQYLCRLISSKLLIKHRGEYEVHRRRGCGPSDILYLYRVRRIGPFVFRKVVASKYEDSPRNGKNPVFTEIDDLRDLQRDLYRAWTVAGFDVKSEVR